MTNLRKRMLEELQRRNYSPATIRGYLLAVEQFAKHFGKSPDKLGPDELRSYQAYLLTERKLAVGSVVGRVAALRFFFVRTLKRREFWEELPYPKDPKDRRRLPTVLSLDEVARLIDAAGNLMQRALLMTLYGTGMRRAEVSLLKATAPMALTTASPVAKSLVRMRVCRPPSRYAHPSSPSPAISRPVSLLMGHPHVPAALRHHARPRAAGGAAWCRLRTSWHH